MLRRRLLFADNDTTFRTVRAEFLRDYYEVFEAGNVQEAEQCLRDDWLHLAILDIRLEDDADAEDMSGLALAKATVYSAIPKIIQTGFPSYEAVRVALGPALAGMPAAISFVSKAEGPEALIRAVENAFAQHVRINWTLSLQSNERRPVTLPHLATLIEPGLTGEQLINRTGELEDLFRRLFYEQDQIRLDQLLWQRTGRVALTVFALREGGRSEALIVVCGQRTQVITEAQHYREWAPKALGATSTALSMQAETTHFAANAYALAEVDLTQVQTIIDLYRTGAEKTLHAALEHLCHKTLSAWHQGQRLRQEHTSLEAIYRTRHSLPSGRTTRQAYEERGRALMHKLPTLSQQLESTAGKIMIHADGQTFSYPDPTPILARPLPVELPVLVMVTPGTLTGDNLLTDADGRTWLTDFVDAGIAPVAWNFTALEAIIRFDWVETYDLQALHSMERCLIESSFSRLDSRNLEPVVRKPVRLIQTLRLLAAETVGPDPLPYHLGILFQAASRLLAFNPTSQLTTPELGRFAHVLLAAAMLCAKLAQSTQMRVEVPEEARGISIDEVNRAVWVDGVRISLTGQSYTLLRELYARANQLCTRRELVERVFGQEYDETDSKQISRLNTAMRRLREKIEADPSQPRYLLTESCGGYRLILQNR